MSNCMFIFVLIIGNLDHVSTARNIFKGHCKIKFEINTHECICQIIDCMMVITVDTQIYNA